MAAGPLASRTWIFFLLLLSLGLLVVVLSLNWGVGLGPLQLTEELWTAVALTSLFGALGGLAFDITEPLRPRKGWSAEAFENRTGLPRLVGAAKQEADWGFLGPLIVGIVAALIAVFLFAVTRPAATPQDGETVPPVSSPFIEPDRLIVLSLIAGFAGPILLRAARSRLVDAMKVASVTLAAAASVDEATANARDGVQQVQSRLPDQVREEVSKALADPQLRGDPERATAAATAAVAEAAGQTASAALEQIREGHTKALRMLSEASGVANPAVE